MDTPPDPPARAPVALLLLLALAGLLYWASVPGFVRAAGVGGDAVMGAFNLILLLGVLWLVLGIALIVGNRDRAMPGWAVWTAAFILPFSAVATVMAEDSPATRPWAFSSAIILPLLFAAYALWARLPVLRRLLPAPVASLLVWGAACFLAFGAFFVSLV